MGQEESLQREALRRKKKQVWGPMECGSGQRLQMHLSERMKQPALRVSGQR